jgi:ribonuclease P protein component
VANYGFPPSARLRHSRDFRAVFSKKQKTSDRFFVVYFLKNSLDRSRVGITVSRKVSTLAVKRNRVKRLIRESFRTHQFFGDGLDIVVIAQRATTLASNQEIISSLEKHWTRVTDRCKKC